MADPDPDSNSNPTMEQVAVAVMRPAPILTPRQTIALTAQALVDTTGRLAHHGKVAWQVARTVGPSTETDQVAVRNELAAMRGDRKAIKRCAGEAVNALVELRAAVRDAEAAKARAETLILEQRARIADARRATTVDAAEFAVAVADDIVRLSVPMMDIDAALDEHRLRTHIIEAALQRRIHAATLVAFESFVEEISAQLGQLKGQVEAVHARAMVPDDVIASCLAVMDLLKLPALPLPTLVLPKWSSAGSKNAKSQWVGDMFAVPELKPPA